MKLKIFMNGRKLINFLDFVKPGYFQSTKTGTFRGANTFQHDEDVVNEMPEPGKAVQLGRLNQAERR